jgi:glutamyl-tRNA synthetase
VLGPDGTRLAKRHGAVTLEDLAARGVEPQVVLSRLAASLALAEPGEDVTVDDLLPRFDLTRLPRQPWALPTIDAN